MRILLVIASSILFGLQAFPQDTERKGLLDGLHYGVEMQATLSSGKTPLWLNANKHGLSSLEDVNGYLRASLQRPLATDSMKRWGVGYGVDVAAAYHFTSNVVVQQAYVEGRWLHGVLTVGSKERPMELKNNRLSSGGQTYGINARPVPQVRLALPDYWEVPLTKGWLSLKGHIAYGRMTDDNWQHEFTGRKSKYADGVLYHSKAGYLKIGNDYRFCQWSLELGLEMASLFGGMSYIPDNDEVLVYKNGTGLKAYWNAFIPGGFDSNETQYTNFEGDQLGSWMVRVNYENEDWGARFYVDKFFEDHSSMFQLDYNGYGTGDEWNTKKKSKYLLYDFKDWMLGIEVNLKRGRWLRDMVFEYIYTKYQSGPVYHDRTPSLSDHVGGRDNYYNHGIFTGWQHWGQVIGNPLYRSPIYNTDGTIEVENNRFMAFHLGLYGAPSDNLSYRLLATYQDGFGTYTSPYTRAKNNVSILLEANYAFDYKNLKGWSIRCGYGMDFGGILGDNYGGQITITKTGLLSL